MQPPAPHLASVEGASPLAALRNAALREWSALTAEVKPALWLVEAGACSTLDQALPSWRGTTPVALLAEADAAQQLPPGVGEGGEAAAREVVLVLPPLSSLAPRVAAAAAACRAAKLSVLLLFLQRREEACCLAAAGAGLRVKVLPLSPVLEADTAVAGDPSLLSFAATLHSLQAAFGTVPFVRGKGASSRAVADELLRLRRSSGAAAAASGSAPPPLLIILDRSVDWTSALVTQSTYGGLLDELLGVCGGRVTAPDSQQHIWLNSSDPVFAALGDVGFGAACDALREQAAALEEGHRRLTRNSDPRSTQFANEPSLSEVKDFVKRLRQFSGTAGLERHITLARTLKARAARKSFQRRLEQDEDAVAAGGMGGADGWYSGSAPGQHLTEEVQALARRGAPLTQLLRLLCLASCTAGGGGMPYKRYSSMRRCLLHSHGAEGWAAWKAARAAGLIQPPAPALLVDGMVGMLGAAAGQLGGAASAAASAAVPALLQDAVFATAGAVKGAAKMVPGAAVVKEAARSGAKAVKDAAMSVAGAASSVVSGTVGVLTQSGAGVQTGFPIARGPLRLVVDPDQEATPRTRAGVAAAVHEPDISFAFSHACLAPLSVRLASHAARQGWREGGAEVVAAIRAQPGPGFEHAQAFDSKQRRAAELPLDAELLSEALRGGEKQTVLVAFAGGVTRAEIAALRALSASAEPSAPRFLVLASQILTAEGVLAQVASGSWAECGWCPGGWAAVAAEERSLSGETALHAACLEGDADAVQRLLDSAEGMGSLESASHAGQTPLHCAVLGGNVKCLSALLRKNADRLAADDGGDTALHLAACLDDGCDLLRLLLSTDSVAGSTAVSSTQLVSHFNRRGATPLHLAAAAGNADALAWLLESAGAEAAAIARHKDESGRTPLFCTAASGRLEALRLLLRRCPDSAAVADDRGFSALHAACEGAHTPCLKALLDALPGAAVKQTAKGGITLLHVACAAAESDAMMGCVELLLARGADPGARSSRGSTAIQIATEEGNDRAVARLLAFEGESGGELRRAEAAKAAAATTTKGGSFCSCFGGGGGVVEPPEEPSQQPPPLPPPPPPPPPQHLAETKDGWTLLHVAASNSRLSVMETLLRKGADVQAATSSAPEGWTALHFAAFEACGEGVRMLLAAGALAGTQTADDDMRTPLHLACASDASAEKVLACVTALLDGSWGEVNVAEGGGEGAMPLHLAAATGSVELVALLLSRGADAAAKRADGKTAAEVAEAGPVRDLLLAAAKAKKTAGKAPAGALSKR